MPIPFVMPPLSTDGFDAMISLILINEAGGAAVGTDAISSTVSPSITTSTVSEPESR